MPGYIGSKAVLLSTTAANVTGNASITGDLTVDTSTLFVDSTNNNVGIGTSSPSAKLHVASGGSPENLELKFDTGAGATSANFVDFNHSRSAGNFTFSFAGTERMRITADGDLLVGKSASSFSAAGLELEGQGRGRFTRDGAASLQLNRLTSDGDIALFYKDGTTVGSIGSNPAGFIYIGKGDTTVVFADTIDAVVPSGTAGATRDNAIDLGNSNNRWDDIYATNGTIQTSDRNEKQDIDVLSEAEQRVAVAAKGLLRKFRWKDAVAEKGDDARIHFGIIAQDLQAAFEAEGLDAGRYAMFIHSTWTDEETGEEKSRMGVRYSELLAFIIGAM